MGSLNNTDFNLSESGTNLDFKKQFFKYLYFWKIFILFTLFLLSISFIYLRYSSKVYNSTAKIQILDKRSASLELPTASGFFSKSNINIENEIEVLKSYPILKQVVKNNRLNLSVMAIGNIKESLVTEYPFKIKSKIPITGTQQFSYKLNLSDEGFEITNSKNSLQNYIFKGNSTYNTKHDLPFEISSLNRGRFIYEKVEGYEIIFSSFEDIVKSLKKSIQISQAGKRSDIIQLDFRSTNPKYSELVLNELVDVFNNDGIKDRQLIHKRTIDFVNDRYSYLSKELDSIEIAKQFYKIDNELVDFSTNSEISIQKSFESEENIFDIENQISIIKLLIKTLDNSELEILPSNMVIENEEINNLISNYNQTIIERKKLEQTAGSNNPSVKQTENIISGLRYNITFSLENHLSQLENIKSKLSKRFYKYNSEISDLPEKEKVLRAIERNQKIKEALYLFLLQKREEAEVSYAVTEPSIKIIEYAITNKKPISPKSNSIYLGAILLGLLIPFSVLYFMFMFNRKIYSKEQFDDLDLPLSVVSEIPEIVEQTNKTISSSHERSPLAESFRVLNSKLKFYGTDNNKDGHVIMVSSTIKGEGKTFCAINIAYTKASFGKKVLLIGADLHNPQIHSYLNIEKNTDGLVNFLVDNKFKWRNFLIKSNSIKNCDILVSGQIPPNPAQLLNNGNFEKLLTEARKYYDNIIVDTPPCLLVSDTLSISHLSNLLLFVVRCNHTDMDVLDFIKDNYEKGLIDDKSLFILNGIGASNKYGYGYAYNYSYGYRYGYKYKYNYNYNYGYGYDYKSD